MCSDGAFAAGELCWENADNVAAGTDHIGEIVGGDLDGDMRDDFVVVDGVDGAWISWGADSLQAAVALAPGFVAWSAAFGRLDDRSMLVLGGAEPVVRVYTFDSAEPTFTELAAPGDFAVARVADFDDDGDADLLVTSEQAEEVWTYYGDGGTGTFSMMGTTPLLGAIADIRPMVANAEFPGVAWLTTDGRLLISAPTMDAFDQVDAVNPDQTYGNPNTGTLAVGAINDDGVDDIVVGYDGRAFVFVSNGSTFEGPTILGESSVGRIVVAVADVDRDGNGDVFARRPERIEDPRPSVRRAPVPRWPEPRDPTEPARGLRRQRRWRLCTGHRGGR